MKSYILALLLVVALLPAAFVTGMKFAQSRDEEAQTSIMRAQESIQDNTLHALESWRTTATACQAKFDVVTILYEPTSLGPAVSPSLPLLHGLFSLSLNDPTQRAVVGPRAAWAIPAQVTPQTLLTGAQYSWIDSRTREVRGTFNAQPIGSPVVQ